jgi:hypothetical protein
MLCCGVVYLPMVWCHTSCSRASGTRYCIHTVYTYTILGILGIVQGVGALVVYYSRYLLLAHPMLHTSCSTSVVRHVLGCCGAYPVDGTSWVRVLEYTHTYTQHYTRVPTGCTTCVCLQGVWAYRVYTSGLLLCIHVQTSLVVSTPLHTTRNICDVVLWCGISTSGTVSHNMPWYICTGYCIHNTYTLLHC